MKSQESSYFNELKILIAELKKAQETGTENIEILSKIDAILDKATKLENITPSTIVSALAKKEDGIPIPKNVFSLVPKKSSLSEFLGIQIIKNINGIDKLKVFHRKYPNETTYLEGDDVLIFNSENNSFIVRISLDEDDEPLFAISCEFYAPKSVWYTEYYYSIEEAVTELKNYISRFGDSFE
jgi:hypothetical protein